ncbi:MAG: clan AA aspartic protease [Gemmatimonadetes bacterium]|nr:clan AA aspartic protease [Gemmatimonadota bacterium]
MTADRYLIAEVKLGAEPRSALIDTGASMSVIDDDLAAALRAGDRRHRAGDRLRGKRASAPVVRVPSLTLGGVPLRDVGMVVLDLDTLGDAECKNIGAVIGNNVMRGAIEVDVGGGVVRLAASPERLGARPGGSPAAPIRRATTSCCRRSSPPSCRSRCGSTPGRR